MIVVSSVFATAGLAVAAVVYGYRRLVRSLL